METVQNTRRSPFFVRMARAFLQRTSFVMEVQAEKEIGNHAAAGALAFLLSAVPVLLLSLGLAGWVLEAFPGDTRRLQAWATQMLGPVHLPDAAPALFGRGFFTVGTIAAVLGLVASSRVFFSSIRRTFKVIWGGKETVTTWVDVAAGYLVEAMALVAVIAVLALSEAARVMLYSARHTFDRQMFASLVAVIEAVPLAVLWGFFVTTLRIFPIKKPGWGRVAMYSLIAVGVFELTGVILHVVINTNQYEVLYGVVANLVLVLLNVSIFFTLYFATATALFVEQNFDALLFGRHFRRWERNKPDLIDDFLFGDISRLLSRYGRRFEPGSALFLQGQTGDTAFFVEQGEVEIVLEGNHAVVAVLGPGEIFGETASLLGEPRTATARARSELLVLELPPAVFGFAIRSDRAANRKLLGTLADRLKQANARS
jgi:uncharacterized BrkB/YihY/UPF0761 family membrane protein